MILSLIVVRSKTIVLIITVIHSSGLIAILKIAFITELDLEFFSNFHPNSICKPYYVNQFYDYEVDSQHNGILEDSVGIKCNNQS